MLRTAKNERKRAHNKQRNADMHAANDGTVKALDDEAAVIKQRLSSTVHIRNDSAAALRITLQASLEECRQKGASAIAEQKAMLASAESDTQDESDDAVPMLITLPQADILLPQYDSRSLPAYKVLEDERNKIGKCSEELHDGKSRHAVPGLTSPFDRPSFGPLDLQLGAIHEERSTGGTTAMPSDVRIGSDQQATSSGCHEMPSIGVTP